MPYRNYGQVDGGSGLGDFLAGLVGGYQSSASEREQLRLAREREQRYAEQQAMEAEDRRLARERQGILDAAQGIYRADQVDPTETVRVGGIDGPDRMALDATSRALQSLPGFGEAGQALGAVAGMPDATERRYQQVGDYAIDRTRFDPELQKRMAADATRVAEGRARRGLMQLTGEDGKPLFQAKEILGQTGDALKGLQSLGATLPIQQRMAAQDRAVRNQDARDMATFQSGLRVDEARQEAKIRAQYERPTYEFITNPTTGSITAVNSKNPRERVQVTDGTGINPRQPNFGYPAGSFVKSTDNERKNAGWGQRATGGIQYLQSHDIPGDFALIVANSMGKGGKGLAGAVMRWGKNQAMGSEGQQYWNALMAAGQGLLRKDTGAQINEDELPMVLDLVGIGPGETSPEIRAQKFEQQDNALVEFSLNAGRAITAPGSLMFQREVQSILDPEAYAKRRWAQWQRAGITDKSEIRRRVAEDLRRRFGAQDEEP